MDDEDERKRARIGAASYWAKQGAAVMCGLSFGTGPLVGSQGFTMCLVCLMAVGYLVVNAMLGFGSKMEFSEMMPLMQEGGMTALSTFVLTWIVVYNLFI